MPSGLTGKSNLSTVRAFSMPLSENARMTMDHALDAIHACRKARRNGRIHEARYHAITVRLIIKTMRVNGWLR